MESQESPKHAPAVASAGGNLFIKRMLSGATFLTLEHVGHMILVVLVPILILAGLETVFSMWTGSTGLATSVVGMASPITLAMGTRAFEATTAVAIVAALLVLTPLLLILDRRTRAEWHKRPGYAGRLAYKAPLYSALGVLGAMMIGAKIELLFVILASLAFIGVPGMSIGALYLGDFLPTLLALCVFAAAAWYLFKLAKGSDYGRTFSLAVSMVSVVTILALFITSLVLLHSSASVMPNVRTDPASPSSDSQSYEDLFKRYLQ